MNRMGKGGEARRKTAIVVGAGVGGVSSAARLAKAGFKVTVVEKNDFRFDQGPSLLLLPQLFHEAFADLGTSLEEEGVHLSKCEPNYEMYFGDGERLTLSSDLSVMKWEVEKWEGKDGFERYLGFMQEAHRHYEISVAQVLKRNFYSIFSMARPEFLRNILSVHPLESIYSRASRYFWSERLRRAFTFSSMYLGMSPFDAPGTFSLLQYTELAEGIWYPKGGFQRVIQALADVGERLGVEYRLSTPVASVKLADGGKRATGVILENGEEILADVVILNCDLVYAYNHLLPQSKQAKSLSKRKLSCSSISFYWSMNRKISSLGTHNVFLANEYRESFDDIFDKQLMPKEPSFYVNVPSRIDPTAAPEGKDAMVVLVPTGHLLDRSGTGMDEKEQDWDILVEKARQTIFDTIEKRTGETGLREAVSHELINTPVTWKKLFNLQNGAILGLSHSFFNVLSFRPSTQHASINRCYFVGASTHPGTGVPICLAGSKLTTEQVLQAFKVEIPWKDTTVFPSRREDGPPPLIILVTAFNFFMAMFLALIGLYYMRV